VARHAQVGAEVFALGNVGFNLQRNAGAACNAPAQWHWIVNMPARCGRHTAHSSPKRFAVNLL